MSKKEGPPKKGGRPATGRSPVAISLRGRRAWKVWLSRVAYLKRMTPSAVMDQALAEWAERYKMDPPPRRLED
jgi:hypothetical protein